MVIRNKEWKKPETQEFLIKKILAPLIKLSRPKRFFDYIIIGLTLAIILYRMLKLPKPEAQYTPYHNIKVLLYIRDTTEKYYTHGPRKKAIIFVMDRVIAKLDSDSHYMSLFDFAVELIFRLGWERRPYQHPSPDYWKEPEPYGGFYEFSDEAPQISDRISNDLRQYIKIGVIKC